MYVRRRQLSSPVGLADTATEHHLSWQLPQNHQKLWTWLELPKLPPCGDSWHSQLTSSKLTGMPGKSADYVIDIESSSRYCQCGQMRWQLQANGASKGGLAGGLSGLGGGGAIVEV